MLSGSDGRAEPAKGRPSPPSVEREARPTDTAGVLHPVESNPASSTAMVSSASTPSPRSSGVDKRLPCDASSRDSSNLRDRSRTCCNPPSWSDSVPQKKIVRGECTKQCKNESVPMQGIGTRPYLVLLLRNKRKHPSNRRVDSRSLRTRGHPELTKSAKHGKRTRTQMVATPMRCRVKLESKASRERKGNPIIPHLCDIIACKAVADEAVDGLVLHNKREVPAESPSRPFDNALHKDSGRTHSLRQGGGGCESPDARRHIR
jgi:hypothetical protein